MQSIPQPGAVVSIRRERWRVAAVAEYGEATRVDVVRLGSRLPATATFFTPFDRIDDPHQGQRPRRVRRQRWRAALDACRARAEHVDLPLAALSSDINIWPYQLEPLLAMRDGRRRVLIADAVGLGKTIQAGLIVAELIRRREAARVLIAAPSHLCGQWREELRARFGLSLFVADATNLAALGAGLPRATNPWSIEGVWIGSLDFLKQPHILDGLPPAPWDLVVIDEAHAVTGHSDRRTAAAVLTERARRVLLLTATPLSGLDDGRVLIRMGAIAAEDPLTVFRRARADVGIATRRRVRRLRVAPSPAERDALDLVVAFAKAATAAATATTADAAHLLGAVLTKRALSTFNALAISVDRRLAYLAGTSSPAIDTTQGALDFGDADDGALTAAIGMAAERERSWMRRLRRAAVAAARSGRKLPRLLTLLSRTREPAIIFTEFRDSLEAVARALSRHGVSFTPAHGGMTPAELHAALGTFRRGDARVLLATDVVSQGLNLHHTARWVIHLDLPWNPIRLEQRAGRVDRLGQMRDVHVTRVVMWHARDQAFAERLDARADAAGEHAALSNTTRWRRRARAAAIVMGRRRRWLGHWRGAGLGRPLAKKGGVEHARTWEVRLESRETLVVTSRDGNWRVPRVSARARRVARLGASRARQHIAFERVLRRRLPKGSAEPVLPGVLPASELRRSGSRDVEFDDARRASDARIRALEADAQPRAGVATARLRFIAD